MSKDEDGDSIMNIQAVKMNNKKKDKKRKRENRQA